jgi:hypothetical protein
VVGSIVVFWRVVCAISVFCWWVGLGCVVCITYWFFLRFYDFVVMVRVWLCVVRLLAWFGRCLCHSVGLVVSAVLSGLCGGAGCVWVLWRWE